MDLPQPETPITTTIIVIFTQEKRKTSGRHVSGVEAASIFKAQAAQQLYRVIVRPATDCQTLCQAASNCGGSIGYNQNKAPKKANVD
ncbi:hypothetical protein ACU4GD_33210 [Cupriavidus basilensis]